MVIPRCGLEVEGKGAVVIITLLSPHQIRFFPGMGGMTRIPMDQGSLGLEIQRRLSDQASFPPSQPQTHVPSCMDSHIMHHLNHNTFENETRH